MPGWLVDADTHVTKRSAGNGVEPDGFNDRSPVPTVPTPSQRELIIRSGWYAGWITWRGVCRYLQMIEGRYLPTYSRVVCIIYYNA